MTACAPGAVPEIPLRVGMLNGRAVPLHPEECEPHTPAPKSYLQWGEWADGMRKTHIQRQCRGCGLWAIWEPKPGTVPATEGEPE